VGYYLEIHRDVSDDTAMSTQALWELLLKEGAEEEEDGVLCFAGGLGHLVYVNSEFERRGRQLEEQVARIVGEIFPHLLIGLDSPYPLMARFRYSWSCSAQLIRHCAQHLLQFCDRHGLRLYSPQSDSYLDRSSVDSSGDFDESRSICGALIPLSGSASKGHAVPFDRDTDAGNRSSLLHDEGNLPRTFER
jgi:hypothetical protein